MSILVFNSFDEYINGVSSDESLEFSHFKDIHVPEIVNGQTQVKPKAAPKETPKKKTKGDK
jgi:hypothetical protein